ncbi:MAG TPA: hypothetical protein VG821_00985 [Rhizomicrobium sp.]|jgi:hypothetical protein|nr:hypothetical protein [Rhizomicrobium sp.]
MSFILAGGLARRITGFVIRANGQQSAASGVQELWSEWHLGEHDMTPTISRRGAILIASCGFDFMPGVNEGEAK